MNPPSINNTNTTTTARRAKDLRRHYGNTGEKNGMWKGDNVGYHALHDYIKYHLPKQQLCQKCNIEPSYDLANISGNYLRDLKDWHWLCRRCHMLSDGRIPNKGANGTRSR